jgi:hypothetical protein
MTSRSGGTKKRSLENRNEARKETDEGRHEGNGDKGERQDFVVEHFGELPYLRTQSSMVKKPETKAKLVKIEVVVIQIFLLFITGSP